MSRWLLMIGVMLSGGMLASAQERPRHIRIETPEHSQERAGYPQEISHFARPAQSPGYTSGWVGGGGFLNFGRGKGETEGTWGWDYTGPSWRPGRIFSSWSERKHPSKGGSYSSESKIHVPDVFAIKKPEKKEEK